MSALAMPASFVTFCSRPFCCSLKIVISFISVLVPTNMQQQLEVSISFDITFAPYQNCASGVIIMWLLFIMFLIYFYTYISKFFVSFVWKTAGRRVVKPPPTQPFRHQSPRGIIVMQDHQQIPVVKCLGKNEFTPTVTVYPQKLWRDLWKRTDLSGNGIDILKRHVNLSICCIVWWQSNILNITEFNAFMDDDNSIAKFPYVFPPCSQLWWHNDHDAKDHTILPVARIDEYITLLRATVFVVDKFPIKAWFLLKEHRSYVLFCHKINRYKTTRIDTNNHKHIIIYMW